MRMDQRPGRALVYCAGGGIGDSLMASIAARALSQRYGAVDALTLPSHRETLARVADFRDVLVDAGEDDAAVADRIREHSYDACVVTWATPRVARIAQKSRTPIRVGQSRRLYSWRFTHRVNVRSEEGDVTTHWSQIVLDYARALRCDTTETIPAFLPSGQDDSDARRLRNEIGVLTEPYVVLHPTNAIAPARGLWPTAGWAALARELRRTFGSPLLLTGSGADVQINERIAAETGDVHVHNIAGKTSIGAFGAIARDALMFAGITTGSMHVAAAVGAPTLGIFPFQTDTPERWAPLGARTAIVRATYRCGAGERKETCPSYACIEHLDVPRIVSTAKSLVGARSLH